LPGSLPAKPTLLWTRNLASPGLGGVAATREHVLVSDRDLNDTTDAFHCLSAETGETLWSVHYPAPGLLDYGNSPRATPVVADGRAYLHGAFGHVTCVEMATGKVLWELNTRDEFEPDDKPKWGTCSTPLLVGDRIIVNPGAKDASVAALDTKTGKVLWKSPGRPAGHGSFVLAAPSGVPQVVGHDADSLGGWDPLTGRRLWRLVPDRPNDFNVPTPIPLGDRLLVSTENNGTRLYAFDGQGKLLPKRLAANRRLAPDSHTPVVTAGRVFGVWRRLFCLDLADGLKELWTAADPGFAGYCTAVADDARVLIVTLAGELILVDATAGKYAELGRLAVFERDGGVYAHPAFVGTRAYVRGSASVVCVDMSR
jgi:outer membrane protein assembly factor BamB